MTAIEISGAHRRSPAVPPGQDLRTARTGFATSFTIFLAEGFYLLLTYTDVLLLKQFRSPEEVAVYYAAAKTLALVAFISFAVGAATAHKFSAYHVAGDRARLAALVRDATRWTFWPSLAVTLLIVAFGKPFLWLFGPAFVAGYPVMFVLAVGWLARASVGPVERLLNMLGEQRICAIVYGFAFALNVCGCVFLIPPFGIFGAACATALAVVVETALCSCAKQRLGSTCVGAGARNGRRRGSGSSSAYGLARGRVRADVQVACTARGACSDRDGVALFGRARVEPNVFSPPACAPRPHRRSGGRRAVTSVEGASLSSFPGPRAPATAFPCRSSLLTHPYAPSRAGSTATSLTGRSRRFSIVRNCRTAAAAAETAAGRRRVARAWPPGRLTTEAPRARAAVPGDRAGYAIGRSARASARSCGAIAAAARRARALDVATGARAAARVRARDFLSLEAGAGRAVPGRRAEQQKSYLHSHRRQDLTVTGHAGTPRACGGAIAATSTLRTARRCAVNRAYESWSRALARLPATLTDGKFSRGPNNSRVSSAPRRPSEDRPLWRER